jgi:hypothetical protein
MAKLRFLRSLHSELGEQKIDVVLRLANTNTLAVYDIAKKTGIQLQCPLLLILKLLKSAIAMRSV